MSNDNNNSGVENWVGELKRIAEEFYSQICALNNEYGEILEYDESALDKFFNKYLEYRDKVHAIHLGSLIDRHKVMAACILSFIADEDCLPFKINKAALSKTLIEAFPANLMFVNELYICDIIPEILSAFVLSTKKSEKFRFSKNNYNIRFPDKTRCWETDEVQPYKEHLIQVLAAMILHDDYDTKVLLIMSHLTFFYEMAYDCAVKGMDSEYYDIPFWYEIEPNDERYSSKDNLEGLYNKLALEHIWVGRTSEQKSKGISESVGIIFADGDNFKQVNDKFGHPVGDEVLKIYGKSITDAIILMGGDINYKAFPARCGGEEFVIFVYGCTLDEIKSLAMRIKQTLCEPDRWFDLKDRNVYKNKDISDDFFPRTFSQGIAYSENYEVTAFEKLMELADNQMYKAKELGRDCICFLNEKI